MFETPTRPIYLDYAATTPVDPRVLAKMLPYFSEVFGNPSSTDHTYGDEARTAVEQARAEVATLLVVAPSRVVFTATATEAINLGIQGFVRHLADKRRARILVSPVEHSAVLETCRGLEERFEAEVRTLRVDGLGRLDLDQIESECRKGIDLVCVQAANNEIGNIYPIAEIAAIARRYDALLFSDLTQACGKIPLALDAMGVAMGTCSAHKIYGPKGAGALITPTGFRLSRLIFGGGPAHVLRPGTVNVAAVVGFGEACRLRRAEMAVDEPRIAAMRSGFEDRAVSALPSITWLGDRASRLAGITGFLLADVEAEPVVVRCRSSMAVSTGAACSRGVPGPSHVALALGVPVSRASAFMRVSFGCGNTVSSVEQAVRALAQSVALTRSALAR